MAAIDPACAHFLSGASRLCENAMERGGLEDGIDICPNAVDTLQHPTNRFNVPMQADKQRQALSPVKPGITVHTRPESMEVPSEPAGVSTANVRNLELRDAKLGQSAHKPSRGVVPGGCIPECDVQSVRDQSGKGQPTSLAGTKRSLEEVQEGEPEDQAAQLQRRSPSIQRVGADHVPSAFAEDAHRPRVRSRSPPQLTIPGQMVPADMTSSCSLDQWLTDTSSGGSLSPQVSLTGWIPAPVSPASVNQVRFPRSCMSDDRELPILVLPPVLPEGYPAESCVTPSSSQPPGTPVAARLFCPPSPSGGSTRRPADPPSSPSHIFHKKVNQWEHEVVNMLKAQDPPLTVREVIHHFKPHIHDERDKMEFKQLCDKWCYVVEYPPGSGTKCLLLKDWLRSAQV